jgi:hypothetical protein
MHFVSAPFALVLSVVSPCVNSLSVDVVIIKFSDIGRAISPLKGSDTVLLSVLVVTLILGSIWPCLNAVAVLFIFFPVSNIISAVHMFVGTSAMSLIVEPLTEVTVSVSMDKSSLSISLIVFPIALVLTAVFPQLNTFAFTESLLSPLAVICSTVVKLIWASGHDVFLSG